MLTVDFQVWLVVHNCCCFSFKVSSKRDIPVCSGYNPTETCKDQSKKGNGEI